MADTTTTTDSTTIVDAYLVSLGEQDPAIRARLVETAWTDDGYLVDPVQEAKGHAELGAIAPAVEEQFPGHKFRRTTAIDEHHGHVRFGWELAAADGTVAVAGIDVGLLAEDGRLRYVAGFFGDLAPTPA
jgi:hypothetical protein